MAGGMVLVVCILLSFCMGNVESVCCPVGFTEYSSNYCYYISLTTAIDWGSAKNNCIGRGGYLVSIGDQSENNAVAAALNSAGSRIDMSLGYSRTSTSSSTWTWADGSGSGSYTNWKPSISFDKVRTKFKPDNTWDDANDSGTNYGLICESNTCPPTPMPTRTPTRDPTSQPTYNPTRPPTDPPTITPTLCPTVVPTLTPTCAPTLQPTLSPTSSPTVSPTCVPTFAPTLVPIRNPTVVPTLAPTTASTYVPTLQPTLAPTSSPTVAPSFQPTFAPTVAPTRSPTVDPSALPSSQPTGEPSAYPTSVPSGDPSGVPTTVPSGFPTIVPSSESTSPSASPSSEPSGAPSKMPSGVPTVQPSLQPTIQPSGEPSGEPSNEPTGFPTGAPSGRPTGEPSSSPSCEPSSVPSGQPSSQPSSEPSGEPSVGPISVPSGSPSSVPSEESTCIPSARPTTQPTSLPSGKPTAIPSAFPTNTPTGQPSVIPTVEPMVIQIEHPTSPPTRQPASHPTSTPTWPPTSKPSTTPTHAPTVLHTLVPSVSPSRSPTNVPTCSPTRRPTIIPTVSPMAYPTSKPTALPTVSEYFWMLKAYGNSRAEFLTSVAITPDWGSIVGGYEIGSSVAEFNAVLLKADVCGDLVWAKICGGSNQDYIRKVVVLEKQRHILYVGEWRNPKTLVSDMLIGRVDELTGATVNTIAISGLADCSYSGYDVAVIQNSAGMYSAFVVGGMTSPASTVGIIALVNLVGSVLWARSLRSDYVGVSITFMAAICISDGDIVAVGGSESSSSSVGIIARFSADGTERSVNQFLSGSGDYAYSVTSTRDGGYAVAASSKVGNFITKLLVLKFSSLDVLQWSTAITGGKKENPRRITTTHDGGYIIVGTTTSFGVGSLKGSIVKLDSAGRVEWVRGYGKVSFTADYMSDVVEVPGGGYRVGGDGRSYTSSSFSDMIIAHIGPGGEMDGHESVVDLGPLFTYQLINGLEIKPIIGAAVGTTVLSGIALTSTDFTVAARSTIVGTFTSAGCRKGGIAYSQWPTSFPTLAPTQRPSTQRPSSSQPTTSCPTTSSPITSLPSVLPSEQPSDVPTTNIPTMSPSGPSLPPTSYPSSIPGSPTPEPTRKPSRVPSKAPSRLPTRRPTSIPSVKPTLVPSLQPTSAPTRGPTASPSHSPTTRPSLDPTYSLSRAPTSSPAESPVHDPTPVPTSSHGVIDHPYGQFGVPTLIPTSLKAARRDGNQKEDNPVMQQLLGTMTIAVFVVTLTMCFFGIRSYFRWYLEESEYSYSDVFHHFQDAWIEAAKQKERWRSQSVDSMVPVMPIVHPQKRLGVQLRVGQTAPEGKLWAKSCLHKKSTPFPDSMVNKTCNRVHPEADVLVRKEEASSQRHVGLPFAIAETKHILSLETQDMIQSRTDIFVDKLSEDFFCAICCSLLEKAAQCRQGHTFCQHCILLWLEDHTTCPTCQESLDVSILGRNRPLDAILGNMQVNCIHACNKHTKSTDCMGPRQKYCYWAGRRCELERHLVYDCELEPIMCPYVEHGCNRLIRRRKMDEHKRSCVTMCKGCLISFELSYIVEHREACEADEQSSVHKMEEGFVDDGIDFPWEKYSQSDDSDSDSVSRGGGNGLEGDEDLAESYFKQLSQQQLDSDSIDSDIGSFANDPNFGRHVSAVYSDDAESIADGGSIQPAPLPVCTEEHSEQRIFMWSDDDDLNHELGTRSPADSSGVKMLRQTAVQDVQMVQAFYSSDEENYDEEKSSTITDNDVEAAVPDNTIAVVDNHQMVASAGADSGELHVWSSDGDSSLFGETTLNGDVLSAVDGAQNALWSSNEESADDIGRDTLWAENSVTDARAQKQCGNGDENSSRSSSDDDGDVSTITDDQW